MHLSVRTSVLLAAVAASATLWSVVVRGATSEADQQAKTFSALPGKAAIYIYRKNGWRGSGGTFPVTVDGARLGRISNGTFFRLEVDPGEHEVWVGWDQATPRELSDPIKSRAKAVLVPIIAVAGQIYFVRVAQVKQGHVAVASEIGKAELLACCKLIAPTVTDDALFH
jgi:Protein of unknown function (DUF2846)